MHAHPPPWLTTHSAPPLDAKAAGRRRRRPLQSECYRVCLAWRCVPLFDRRMVADTDPLPHGCPHSPIGDNPRRAGHRPCVDGGGACWSWPSLAARNCHPIRCVTRARVIRCPQIRPGRHGPVHSGIGRAHHRVRRQGGSTMRWYANVAVGGLVAAVLVWLAAWMFSPYPWAPPRSFEFVGGTYHVTRTTVRAVGPRVNWAASGPPPRILYDLWAVPGITPTASLPLEPSGRTSWPKWPHPQEHSQRHCPRAGEPAVEARECRGPHRWGQEPQALQPSV